MIGGYTDPEGSRVGLGALLLVYYAPEGRLRRSMILRRASSPVRFGEYGRNNEPTRRAQDV